MEWWCRQRERVRPARPAPRMGRGWVIVLVGGGKGGEAWFGGWWWVEDWGDDVGMMLECDRTNQVGAGSGSGVWEYGVRDAELEGE